jgi:hypothetical protein
VLFCSPFNDTNDVDIVAAVVDEELQSDVFGEGSEQQQ